MSSRIPRPTTTNLPRVRKALLVSLVATALLNLLATVSLLIFQLTKTRGYQKPVPAITAGAFVSLLLSLHFLFSTATSISRLHLPVRIELFVRSIAFELVCYAGMAAYFLVSVSDLHADTPGLLTSCGGYMICRMLTATAALTWLSFLAAMLNFVLIFASLFYLTVHRALPIVAKSAEVPFEGVDWRVYRNRGVRPRTGTIRHGGAPNRDRQREKSLHGGESTYGIRNDTDSVATYADTIHTSFSGGSIVDMGRFDWERGARDGERVIPVSPLVQIDMEPEEEDEEEEEEENAVEMKAVGGEKAEKEAEEEPGVANCSETCSVNRTQSFPVLARDEAVQRWQAHPDELSKIANTEFANPSLQGVRSDNSLTPNDTATAIELLCDADRRGHVYLVKIISQKDPIFSDTGTVSPISELFRLPLLLERPGRDRTGIGRERINESAKSLMIDPDTGVASAEWDEPGTILLARQDQRDLNIAHAEIILAFFAQLRHEFEMSGSCERDKMTRERFKAWCGFYIDWQKRIGRGGWDLVTNPGD